jgi:hypothetical protein
MFFPNQETDFYLIWFCIFGISDFGDTFLKTSNRACDSHNFVLSQVHTCVSCFSLLSTRYLFPFLSFITLLVFPLRLHAFHLVFLFLGFVEEPTFMVEFPLYCYSCSRKLSKWADECFWPQPNNQQLSCWRKWLLLC